MSSIDDLFRKPSATSKRKLEDPTTNFGRQTSKSAKLSNGTSPRSSGKPKSDFTNGSASKAAFVEDEAENQDDLEAGPSLPPDDVDEDVDDDEEGRFFGGGVSKQEKEVLDYIDKNEEDGDGEEKIDSAWLRRTAINFERKINKNAELRAKYEADPMKFVGSEADLDTEIKGLSLLSEHGELYEEFVKMGCAGSLVGLLAHENTDIAISVCELLAELTDEDSAASDDQWKVLVDAIVESDVLDLLVSNLSRLDEEANSNDQAGVYHVLSVVENLLSQSSNVEKIGSSSSTLSWLLSRIKHTDSQARNKVSQNRQYSAEILAILLQSHPPNRDRFAEQDGVDDLLQLLSTYRKRDPEKDSDEEEFVENLFDSLTCVVESTVAAEKFLAGEGVELCLIMLREGQLSKWRALKVLDHAMGGADARAVCERVVEAAGLKTTFGMIKSNKSKKMEREAVEHLIGILASLLRYTPPDSPARIRTLAKFVEREYEKITRLVELRKEYQARVKRIDEEIERERQNLSPEEADAEVLDEWLSRRLDAGLFALQTLDVILAWLVAEDDGARKRITELLPPPAGDGIDDGLKVLAASLTAQLEGMDDVEEADTNTKSEAGRGGNSAREMLEALLQCLQ